MNRSPFLSAALLGSPLLAIAAPAPAQSVTYYLRSGSSDQQGCFIGCACWTSSQEPLRGSFVLTPGSPDPVFENFVVSDAVFRVPTFGQLLSGGGTYRIGGDPAALERMQLDLSVDANSPLHWDSGSGALDNPPRIITSTLTIHNYQCYDIVLTLRATSLLSDWNADGVVGVRDLFAFLGGWFGGDGDANEDGQTDIADVFEFLNAWFAGV